MRISFSQIDIVTQLNKLRSITRTGEDEILQETKRILKNDLFTEKKILENLGRYNEASAFVDEEDVDASRVYTVKEIKTMATQLRLKFLDTKDYKPEIPYEAILKIKDFNATWYKELKEFKVLAPAESFRNKSDDKCALLFVKTNYDNYYLMHTWGNKLAWNRKLKYWPLRTVETLALTIFVFTLIVTLCLPTEFITLDRTATYWCGYRAGTFFHLLIFFSGFTTYFTITFAGNFSSGSWNKRNDLD